MTGAPPEDANRRYLIAVGTKCYPAPTGRLESVPHDLAEIEKLFVGELGFRKVTAVGPANKGLTCLNPTLDEFRQQINAWFRDCDARTDQDNVVVYYSGHGSIGPDDAYYLHFANTNETNLLNTGLSADGFAGLLHGTPVNHLLVILDTCAAGHGVEAIVAKLKQIYKTEHPYLDRQYGYYFISNASEIAEQGRFVREFGAIVRQPRYGGRLQPHLKLDDVVPAVDAACRAEGRGQVVLWDKFEHNVPCYSLPNPRYRPDSLDSTFASHWLPRGLGAAEGGAGDFFTGRTRALQELAAWLVADAVDFPGRLVIGKPGSGKSSVLARLVLMAEPKTRGRLDPATTIDLSPGVIDVAIHAQNLRLDEVVRAIAGVAEVDAYDNSIGSYQPTLLIEALKRRAERLTVVIDAVEESERPDLLVRSLILPLAQARSTTRLLVAVRTPFALRHAFVDELWRPIDLDRSAYLETDAIVDYITRRLTTAEPAPDGRRSPYVGAADLARRVAERVASRAEGNFLAVMGYTRSLAQAERPVDLGDPGWFDRIAVDAENPFAAYFDQFERRFGAATTTKIRDILTPLAWAEGRGLPVPGIWARVASRLAGRPYNDDDIDEALNLTRDYWQEELVEGQSVYRLFHRELARYLQLYPVRSVGGEPPPLEEPHAYR